MPGWAGAGSKKRGEKGHSCGAVPAISARLEAVGGARNRAARQFAGAPSGTAQDDGRCADWPLFSPPGGFQQNSKIMNSPSTGLRFASIVFGLACFVHVGRLLTGFEIQIGPYHVGIWPSVVVSLVFLVLSLWMGQLACASRKAERGQNADPHSVG
jgi:hypothetical protein